MTRRQYDEMIARGMSEKIWEQQVQRMLDDAGFHRHYHTLRSKGSDKGFPDDVAIHDTQPRMVWLELKRQTGKRWLTLQQIAWLDDLVRLKRVFPFEVYAPVRPLDSDALWLSLFEGATPAEGGLHQWCLDPACGKCGPERASATGLPRARSGSSRGTSAGSRKRTKRSPSSKTLADTLPSTLPSSLSDRL